ncbi:MAG: arginine--tRNA ligase [Rhodospirillales bacterium]
MNVFNEFHARLLAQLDSLRTSGRLPADAAIERVTMEPPRDASHGDLSTNAAMVLAKPAGLKPRDLAEDIAALLRADGDVESVEIAGPGFINLRLDAAFWRKRIGEALKAGIAYGDSTMGGGAKVNVEYVSANPTGPLHVGHARGAVVGDALAALLDKAGYAVTKEYYINDAGAQIDSLARAVRQRYLVAIGRLDQAGFDRMVAEKQIEYGGDYLVAPGEAIAAADGDRWADSPEEEWLPEFRDRAVDMMMQRVREDLQALGISQEVFSSERALVESGAVDAVFAELEAAGHLYHGVLEPPKGMKPDDWEPRPQTLFRATEFGDDVDRPLKKSDGSWTYFATDIAYHLDKYRRGFAEQIDVWGADHGGYVKRMQAALKAVSGGKASLDVKLCQLVQLMKGGEPFRMSKRAGNFVTVRDLIDEVGKDVVRFIMLTRRNDAQMEFDLDKATEQSRDNPVFYVQYAHARVCSVMRMAAAAFPDTDLSDARLAEVPLEALDSTDELDVMRKIAEWPRAVEAAAQAHEAHRLAFYLNDLASMFHALWTRGREDASLRFVHESDRDLTLAKLALARAVAVVIASGLTVFGVEPVEEMR